MFPLLIQFGFISFSFLPVHLGLKSALFFWTVITQTSFNRILLFHPSHQEMEPPKLDRTFLTTSSQFGERSGGGHLFPVPTQMLRDPLNGAWCDTLRFAGADNELTPCGDGNNFYSSAGLHHLVHFKIPVIGQKSCSSGVVIYRVFFFFTGPPPKKLKYGKPRLG